MNVQSYHSSSLGQGRHHSWVRKTTSLVRLLPLLLLVDGRASWTTLISPLNPDECPAEEGRNGVYMSAREHEKHATNLLPRPLGETTLASP